jgi:hypothetical protein
MIDKEEEEEEEESREDKEWKVRISLRRTVTRVSDALQTARVKRVKGKRGSTKQEKTKGGKGKMVDNHSEEDVDLDDESYMQREDGKKKIAPAARPHRFTHPPLCSNDTEDGDKGDGADAGMSEKIDDGGDGGRDEDSNEPNVEGAGAGGKIGGDGDGENGEEDGDGNEWDDLFASDEDQSASEEIFENEDKVKMQKEEIFENEGESENKIIDLLYKIIRHRECIRK